MSNRTVWSLVIIGVILLGAWGATQYTAAKRTARYLNDLSLSDDSGKVMDALAELRSRGASVGPRLAAIVQAQTPEAAPRAAWLLGMVGSHAGDDALAAALSSKDPALRSAALQALGQLRLASAETAVAAILSNQEEKNEIRVEAANCLGMIGTQTAAAALAKALGERPAPEAEAAPGMSAAAPAAATPTAEPTVVDAPTVRFAAARALGIMGQPTGIEALAKTLEPKVELDNEVRVAAAYALGDLGARADEEAGARQATEALLAGLQDEFGDVRIAAAHSLSKVRVPEAMKASVGAALTEAKSDKHFWARLATTQAQQRLGLAPAAH